MTYPINMGEIFKFLLEEGLVYRYPEEEWKNIEKHWPGHQFPSPRQTITEDGVKIVEELIQPLVELITISQKELQQLRKIATAITEFFTATYKFVRENTIKKKEKSQILHNILTPLELQNIHIYSGYHHLMPLVRLDCLRTSLGFKIVDINSTRPAGLGAQIVLNIAFADYIEKNQSVLPIEEIFLNTVSQCWQDWQKYYHKQKEKPRIALTLPNRLGDYRNFKILQNLLSEHFNCECKILTVAEFGNLTDYNLVIRERIKEESAGYEKLTEVFPEQCCVITPLYNRWLGNKLWMYYFAGPLSNYYQEKMNKENYEILLNSFPKTGFIRYKKVIEFPKERISIPHLPRKNYLFKPGKGSSARGIIFGCKTSRKKWENALGSDNAKGGVIQEFLPVKEIVTVLDNNGFPQKQQLYTKYGIFILGGQLAGIELMARRSKIVHGARDTYFAPVFVQKEKK